MWYQEKLNYAFLVMGLDSPNPTLRIQYVKELLFANINEHFEINIRTNFNTVLLMLFNVLIFYVH